MFSLKIRLAMTISLLSSSACYAELNPQLGLWESTSEIPAEQKAMFEKMPPEAMQQMQKSGMRVDPKAGTMSMTYCLNKEKIDQWQHMGQKPQQNCDKPQISYSGNVVTMDMTCSKPHASKMRNVVTFNSARDAYQYMTKIDSDKHSMTLRGSAKRLGDCK